MAAPNCRDVEPVIACYSPPDPAAPRVSLVAHHVYSDTKKLIVIYFTDDAGAVFDTSAGTVSFGECPVYPPDVEWEQLCDKLADGTIVEFMCRTITYFDTVGQPVDPPVVTTFEMDKVTEYVPINPVDCSACCDDAVVGVITDLSVLDDCLV